MKTWDQMTAQERDALVAEEVMGWTVAEEQAISLRFVHMGNVLHPNNVPRYTTDIAASWEVVEKTERDLDCHFILAHTPGWGYWAASFHGCASDATKDYGVADTKGNAQASSAPEAICLAALRAVGVET